MPELPEVETIKIGLQKKIIGLKIINVEILNPKTFQGNEKEIIGGEVVKVWRAAKMLGIDLKSGQFSVGSVQKKKKQSSEIPSPLVGEGQGEGERGKSILFHLKMSGQIIYQDKKTRFTGGHPTLDMKDAMPNKSTRVVFALSDGSNIFFNDQRKFGWVKVVETSKVSEDNFYKGLGPEPLDKSFTPQLLKEQLLKHKNWPIKVVLMDQQTISGIGNIYAAEACFDAKLDPRVKVSELDDKDFELLYKGIIRSLKDGIKYGGSSRANFVNAEGEKGLFLDYAFVYGRKGDPCKVCATPIEKIELGGRGTYFCPNCQKPKK